MQHPEHPGADQESRKAEKNSGSGGKCIENSSFKAIFGAVLR
jgi:hypothetical protein